MIYYIIIREVDCEPGHIHGISSSKEIASKILNQIISEFKEGDYKIHMLEIPDGELVDIYV